MSEKCRPLKPSKCSFGSRRIAFLGFVVENGHIQPGKEKTKAIAEYPTPTDVHAVGRFLGLTGFFRRFVNGYAVMAEPLNQLMKKDTVFIWTRERQESFGQLQKILASGSVQAMFVAQAAVTELYTDASSMGLGVIFLQAALEGELLCMVYCASRRTSEAEFRYYSSKLELLCIVWAMNTSVPAGYTFHRVYGLSGFSLFK